MKFAANLSKSIEISTLLYLPELFPFPSHNNQFLEKIFFRKIQI
jgi:hypothetical protein